MFIKIGDLTLNAQHIVAVEKLSDHIIIYIDDKDETEIRIDCKDPEKLYHYICLSLQVKDIPIKNNVGMVSFNKPPKVYSWEEGNV